MSSRSFDQEQAIESWRQHIEVEPNCTREAAEELEGHLRDQMARLVGMGLAAEEAFLVARTRLGPARDLQEEFAKVTPTKLHDRPAFWVLAGAILFFGSGWAVTAAADGALWFGHALGLSLPVLAGAKVAATLGTAALALLYAFRWASEVRERRGRALGGLLGLAGCSAVAWAVGRLGTTRFGDPGSVSNLFIPWRAAELLVGVLVLLALAAALLHPMPEPEPAS